MVAAPPKEVRLELCQRVDALVRDGVDPREAAAIVLGQMRREGMGDEIADLLDEKRIAMDIWRQWVSVERSDDFPPHPGRRKVDTEALQDEACLMETLHYVGGKWRTLGDLNKAECLGFAEHWRGVAKDATEKAEFLERIAAKLKANQRVRDRFTEAELRAI